jgi:hypothetical protein
VCTAELSKHSFGELALALLSSAAFRRRSTKGGGGQRGRLTCRRPQCRPRACCISASPWHPQRRRPYFSASSRALARSCSLCLEVLSPSGGPRAVVCVPVGAEGLLGVTGPVGGDNDRD